MYSSGLPRLCSLFDEPSRISPSKNDMPSELLPERKETAISCFPLSKWKQFSCSLFWNVDGTTRWKGSIGERVLKIHFWCFLNEERNFCTFKLNVCRLYEYKKVSTSVDMSGLYWRGNKDVKHACSYQTFLRLILLNVLNEIIFEPETPRAWIFISAEDGAVLRSYDYSWLFK